MQHDGYTATGRFWLVFILTICVLCCFGCGDGGLSDDPEQSAQASIPAAPSASAAF